MHFRHHQRTELRDCLVAGTRVAITQALQPKLRFSLPTFSVSESAASVSGRPVSAIRSAPPEHPRIAEVAWLDELQCRMRLEDGRELSVRLVTTAAAPGSPTSAAANFAEIQLLITDPSLASLAPDELLKRIALDTDLKTWCHHWRRDALHGSAREEVERALAARNLEVAFAAAPVSADTSRPSLMLLRVPAVDERRRGWRAAQQLGHVNLADARTLAEALARSRPEENEYTDRLLAAVCEAIAARSSRREFHAWLDQVALGQTAQFRSDLLEVLVTAKVVI